jgi:hypothetical protein
VQDFSKEKGRWIMEKVYTTLDAYQARFQKLKGHSPKLVLQDDKVVFLFEATDAFFHPSTLRYDCRNAQGA